MESVVHNAVTISGGIYSIYTVTIYSQCCRYCNRRMGFADIGTMESELQ